MWTTADTVVAIVDPVLCLATLTIGLIIVYAADPWPWYNSLTHARWHPPRWLFGAAWVFNYVMLAVGGILSRYFYDLGNGTAGVFVSGQVMYYLQFLLHIVWAIAFWSFQSLSGGFVVMCALVLSSIAATVLFYFIHWGAGIPLTLYTLWIIYAASLNLYAMVANRASLHHPTYVSPDGDVTIGKDVNAPIPPRAVPPLGRAKRT